MTIKGMSNKRNFSNLKYQRQSFIQTLDKEIFQDWNIKESLSFIFLDKMYD